MAPELKREASDADIAFAKGPLEKLDAQREKAYQDRRNNIVKAFSKEIDPRRREMEKTNDLDRHSQLVNEINWFQGEMWRKVKQLDEIWVETHNKTTFQKVVKSIDDFLENDKVKTAGYVAEAGSAATKTIQLSGNAAMLAGVTVAGNAILLMTPVTAILAALNAGDVWIGRAIGWINMARKQWDADCSRISVRIATAIKDAYNNSETHIGRTTGDVFAGADKSTISRQRLEKILQHKVLEIRTEMIKYKIKETEVTAQAEEILKQKNAIQLKVHECRAAIAKMKGYGAQPAVGGKRLFSKRDVNEEIARLEAKANAQEEKCMELSVKIADLLNEVMENANRLINEKQRDVDKMLAEVVKSFLVTEFQGKFTGAHTQGAWRQKLRKLNPF